MAACQNLDMESVTVAQVLAGQASYDDLDEQAQAAVRTAWDQRLAEDIANLNFSERLRAAGRPWAEADADGNVVWREPGPAASDTTLRRDQGLTHTQLAERLGVNLGVARAIERRTDGGLTVDIIAALAEVLGVTPGELFPAPCTAAHAPDDCATLEAALHHAGKELTREDLARALDWTLDRVHAAEADLRERLHGTGARLAGQKGLRILSRTTCLTPEQQRGLVRRSLAQRSLTVPEAQLLRRIADSPVAVSKLGNPERVYMSRFLKAGIVLEQRGHLVLASEFRTDLGL